MKKQVIILVVFLLALPLVLSFCSDDNRILRISSYTDATGDLWDSDTSIYPFDICYNLDDPGEEPHTCRTLGEGNNLLFFLASTTGEASIKQTDVTLKSYKYTINGDYYDEDSGSPYASCVNHFPYGPVLNGWTNIGSECLFGEYPNCYSDICLWKKETESDDNNRYRYITKRAQVSQGYDCESDRTKEGLNSAYYFRSEERRVGKECRSRWSPYH